MGTGETRCGVFRICVCSAVSFPRGGGGTMGTGETCCGVFRVCVCSALSVPHGGDGRKRVAECQTD